MDAALEADPGRPALWALRAVFFRALGREEEPERDLARAKAAGLEGEAVFEYLFARSAAASGDSKIALEHLERVAKLGLADARIEQDAKAGLQGWFGGDPEVKKKLEALLPR
jgi:hypothetical protein